MGQKSLFYSAKPTVLHDKRACSGILNKQRGNATQAVNVRNIGKLCEEYAWQGRGAMATLHGAYNFIGREKEEGHIAKKLHTLNVL